MRADNSAPVTPGRYIVLVIDDAPETLGLVSDALENDGMTVLVARSGEEGIRLTQRVRPDVILLDALMPGMDGFETCRRLKAPPISEAAPVIFMTGLTEPEHILSGLRAGGVDYVTKPVVIDELIARITRHVMNARAIQSARAALDYADQSVLAMLADGRLSWGTQSALAEIENMRGAPLFDGDHATGPLRDWLLEMANVPVSQARPLFIEELTLTMIGFAEGELMVRLRSGSGLPDDQRLLTAFGLTAREAEVLLWLSHGKTNRDIADILSVSARTVNKHLEQVFHKMGVDNRTSAAVMADRVLQSS
ncbi:LuxR family two component transcriptional regulator [Primorskyibacter sedentarius]|uniref:LuxR family two component transcriptional regulator n=1 Tax=Primorskyibacter sedentarius TaxID=745311 RepID=A0A4R3J2A4_9RHOB|nr:DNA-binding response regulator [Primorskyibacter sedentarius]TCS59929.1 LuxR family two component transcriptional regulator [Primorskyibacter sedentarius]